MKLNVRIGFPINTFNFTVVGGEEEDECADGGIMEFWKLGLAMPLVLPFLEVQYSMVAPTVH